MVDFKQKTSNDVLIKENLYSDSLCENSIRSEFNLLNKLHYPSQVEDINNLYLKLAIFADQKNLTIRDEIISKFKDNYKDASIFSYASYLYVINHFHIGKFGENFINSKYDEIHNLKELSSIYEMLSDSKISDKQNRATAIFVTNQINNSIVMEFLMK